MVTNKTRVSKSKKLLQDNRESTLVTGAQVTQEP